MLKVFNRFKKNRCGYVYYARLEKSERVFYAVGYSIEASLREHLIKNDSGNDESMEKVIFFTYREDAFDVFKKINSLLKSKRRIKRSISDPSLPLRDADHLALFLDDVLGLDAKLYELSDAAKESEKGTGLGCFFILVGLFLIPFTAGISIALVLVFLGAFAIYEHHVGHGEEIESKKKPVLPKRLSRLVDLLY